MPVQTILSTYTDGPALTAAAAASCLPTYAPTTLPAGYWQIGRVWRVTLTGRISVVVTTPGTLRWDVRLGGTVVADTLAVLGNIVAKTNVGFYLEGLLTCRAVGSGTSCRTVGGMGRPSSGSVPPPTQATTSSGKRPIISSDWARASRPMSADEIAASWDRAGGSDA